MYKSTLLKQNIFEIRQQYNQKIGSLYSFLCYIPHWALQGWISWIIYWIAHRKLLYCTEQRESQRPATFRIYCNSTCWNKSKVDGKITSSILSNNSFKLQLNLISSQRPEKLGSVKSFTFIFSCYLQGIRNLYKV